MSSGIDYNAIIEKYTATTLLQERPAAAQITKFNAQNVAVLRITNLLGAVQDALTELSNPASFGAYSATVGSTVNGSPAAIATQIPGQTPIAGTYVVNAQTVATATTIVNDPAANGVLNSAVPLDQAGAAILASNGPNANGIVTINGVLVNYNVSTQTVGTIVSDLNAALASSTGGTAVLNADGTVTLTGVQTLGSGADSGNLLSVLKLDTAQLSAGVVTSSAPIAGLSQYSVLNQNGNAGLATAVTGGTFTINGVSIALNPAQDTLAGIISRINASAAGVVASYDAQSSSLRLSSKTEGPQSILLGATSDTSNFLSATGISTGTTIAEPERRSPIATAKANTRSTV